MYATYEEQMMTEALEEHDKGCCTAEAPCTLRTGITVVLNRKQLRPDVRATENAPFQPSAGSGSGRAVRTVSPTGPQSALWARLMDQIRELTLDDGTAEDLDKTWNGITQFRKYSDMIDTTIRFIKLIKKTREVESPKTVAEELKPGMYSIDGQIYKVQLSGAGRPYALILNGSMFEYERGAIRKLSTGNMMSLEEAKAYGRETGVCCQCGRTLTNPESIQEGIGPICAGKF